MEWCAFIDGASSGNPGEAGAGIVIFSQDKVILKKSIYLGSMTNNMAEYEALLFVLNKALEKGIENLTVHTDSLLVANQVSGTYKVKNPILKDYFSQVRRLLDNFKHFSIKYIPREKNRIADSLAKKAIKNRGRRVAAPPGGEESPGIAGQDGP